MIPSPSFEQLLGTVRAGDTNEIGAIVVRRFGAQLVALSASHLSQRLQPRVDAEDVVQSIFKTFFRQLGDEQLELNDWDSLWGLLAQAAMWRICRYAKHHLAQKRSLAQETSLAPEGPPEARMLNREPNAADVLVADELQQQLLAGLKEQHRPIVVRILDGATHEAIATELRTSISTVERVHRRAKEVLRGILETDEHA